MRCTRRPKSTYCKPFQKYKKRRTGGSPLFLWRQGVSVQWRRSSKGGTYVPALDGLECGLRLAKSRRYAAVARWTPAAAGVRGHTAHKRRPFAPSCESPPLPSGRAVRAKVSPAFAVPPGCLDRASRTDATPWAGARCTPLRKGYGGAPWGGTRPSCCLWRLGGRGKASRTLRAQRAHICGSKCRNSFFFSLGGWLRAKKEMG